MEVRNKILDSVKVLGTIDRLCLRIEDRFPESGLLELGHALHEIATETDLMIDWVERPNYLLRVVTYGFAIFMLVALIVGVAQLEFEATFKFSHVLTIAEAATNEIILVGAAIAFLVTFETRQKRKRVIAAIGQLRSIAHVIDAHQLTKDPGAGTIPTEHSPDRNLTPDEMSRYLNYCSEMLSLTSKVAFLYVQKFPDPTTEEAVHDLETLTIGLGSKIWQKLILLNAMNSP